MKELPIIFNTEMVKAILSGDKTSTRRPLKRQPNSHHWDIFSTYKLSHNLLECQKGLYCCFKHTAKVKGQDLLESDVDVKAPCQIDDILYVRETWQKLLIYDADGYMTKDSELFYLADGIPDINLKDENGYDKEDQTFKWKPSIHMPKSVARIFLKVTGVRVERAWDITEEDAIKEGMSTYEEDEFLTHADIFMLLWNKIYSNWKDNPWVWVIDFEVVT